MARLPLPAFALTLATSLLACGGDDDGGPGPDAGNPNPPPVTTITSGPDPITRQTSARIEFSSELPGASFTCTLDSQLGEPCVSPFEITVLDGEHRFNVFAHNPDGSANVVPAYWNWRVDTVAPMSRMLQGPSPIDNSSYPEFTFVAVDDEEVTFGCRIDERDEVPCSSPWHSSVPVGKGPHRFEVRATDLAGNVQVVPTVHEWSADLALPDTVIDSGPSGVSNSRDVTFTFSALNATLPARFECRVSQFAPWQPCTSPFSFTLTNDGAKSFSVQAIDANNIQDPIPAVRTWTLDTVGPYVELTSYPAAITSDATPSYTFVYGSDATQIGCRMVRSGNPDPAFLTCSGTYDSLTLPEGLARFEVRVQDLAGNATIVGRDVTIDTVPPTVTITHGQPSLSTDNTPSFEFVTSGATSVQCRIDNAAWLACTSPYTSPNVLSDSSHYFDVRAFDAAQNVAAASNYFTIDATPPTITFTGGPTIGNGPTADNTPTFTFSVSGAIANGVSCRVGTAGAYSPCASPVTLPVTADGDNVFNVRAVDNAGNVRIGSRVFSISTAPLSITFTGGPTGATRDRSPLFTWSTTGAVVSTSCRHDAGVFGNCSVVMGTDLPDGPHTLEVRVADDLGNSQNATVSFTVDTVAPGVAFTSGPSGTIDATDVSFGFDSSGAPTVTECRLFRTGMASGAYAPCSSPHAVTLVPPSSPYNYTFEVRVTDAAGNQWSAYRSFTYSSN